MIVILASIVSGSLAIVVAVVPVYTAPIIGLISFLICVFVQFKWTKNHWLAVCIWILIWAALTVYTASGSPNGLILLYETLTFQLGI